VKGDDASLRTGNPTSMLENANCFKEKDGEFIQNTINDRLGGKRQVSMIIRHQFRSLTGEGAGASNNGGGSERDALVSMFLECNGPNWKQRRNWMEDAPLGEWDGVKVLEGRDAVAELQLNANNVAGQFLDMFVVSHGALFANLACMNIEDNNATGSIPWEVLRDLVQDHALRKISLGNNKFDSVGEIPPLVSEMNKLEELNLHTLGFTGSVPDFSACVNLEYLRLDENQLAGSVPDFSACVNLQNLCLNKNQLTGLDSWKANKANYPSQCNVY